MDASDITLISSDLLPIVTAIDPSRAAMRTVKQDLFWPAGIPLPLSGELVKPMFAAAAMAFSSVSVASSSLRLRRSCPS
jgi:cation transport ATPase